MSKFSDAVIAKDLEAVEEMLSDEVVFRSPVAFSPYPGKAITNAILRSVVEVFEGLHYVREIRDGNTEALVFEAKVNGLELTGCDFIVYDDDGQIVDFMVMVRPLKAAAALAERMAERYPAIQEAAAAWAQDQ